MNIPLTPLGALFPSRRTSPALLFLPILLMLLLGAPVRGQGLPKQFRQKLLFSVREHGDAEIEAAVLTLMEEKFLARIVKLWDEHQAVPDSEDGQTPVDLKDRVIEIGLPFASKTFARWNSKLVRGNHWYLTPAPVRTGLLRKKSTRFMRLPIGKVVNGPFSLCWKTVADVIVDLENGKVHDWKWRVF